MSEIRSYKLKNHLPLVTSEGQLRENSIALMDLFAKKLEIDFTLNKPNT